jgi:hypothetical protein
MCALLACASQYADQAVARNCRALRFVLFPVGACAGSLNIRPGSGRQNQKIPMMKSKLVNKARRVAGTRHPRRVKTSG